MKNQSENIKLSNVKKKNNNFPSYMYLPTHLLIVWVGNAKRWPYEFFFLICNKKRYFVLAWHGIKWYLLIVWVGNANQAFFISNLDHKSA
jgi:hypothetical protein